MTLARKLSILPRRNSKLSDSLLSDLLKDILSLLPPSLKTKPPHIGQYRVIFKYAKCGETTVMSQVIKDNEDSFTFRPWNHEKLNVDYGVSTASDQGGCCESFCLCALCFKLTNCILDSLFDEVIDVARDGKISAEDFFKEQEANLGTSAKLFRWLGVFLTMFSIYLMFSPIMELLNWIPLIGGLLKAVAAIAAAITAFIVGGTVATATIAVAWVVFRPLIGMLLLTITGLGVYLTFFFDWAIVFPESAN